MPTPFGSSVQVFRLRPVHRPVLIGLTVFLGWFTLGFLFMLLRMTETRENPLHTWLMRFGFGVSALAFIGAVMIIIFNHLRQRLVLAESVIREHGFGETFELGWDQVASFRRHTNPQTGKLQGYVLFDSAGQPQFAIRADFYRDPEAIGQALGVRLSTGTEEWASELPPPGPAVRRTVAAWDQDLARSNFLRVFFFLIVLVFTLLMKWIKER